MQRPRPVLNSAGIAAGVTSLAGILTFLGYNEASAHLSAETQTITSILIAAVTLGSHTLAAMHGEKQVTPVHDPVADDGIPLVRADSVAAGHESRPDQLDDPLPDLSEEPDESGPYLDADGEPLPAYEPDRPSPNPTV